MGRPESESEPPGPPDLPDRSDDSDSSSSSERRAVGGARKKRVMTIEESSAESDSSDGQSDKCPICLLRLSSREVATPDSCAHEFCVDCIREWSRHVNTCPVDRIRFDGVIVRDGVTGEPVRLEAVRRGDEAELPFQEPPTFCGICQSEEHEDTMLLCDSCEGGYHMACLDPPLEQVPEGDWFCPGCALAHSDRRSFGELSQEVSVEEPCPSTSRRAEYRITRTSSSARRMVRKRRRKRVRKTISEYEIGDNGKFPMKTGKRTIRKKRKPKRKPPRTAARRNHVRSSVRGRLAEMFKSSSSQSSHDNVLSRIVAPQLKLFGDANELDFPDSEEEEIYSALGSGSVAVAIAPRLHASAILEARRQERRKTIRIPSPEPTSSASDLLSSIMEHQALFHSKNSSLSVKRDGSLVVEVPRHIAKDDTKKIGDEKPIDVQKSDSDSLAKQAPAYGSGRGNAGNYRGGRNDYQDGGNQNRNNRTYYQQSGSSGNYRENSNYGNETYSSSSGNSYFNANSSWSNNSRNQREQFANFHDRPLQQRNAFNNRGRGMFQRFSPHPNQRSRNLPQWQPQQRYSEPPNDRGSSSFPLESQHNRSYDDRTEIAYDTEHNNANNNLDDVEQFGNYEVTTETINTSQGRIPQPSIIRFQKPALSDDDNNETPVTLDEDKYDPTEPTLGDSSEDDDVVSEPVVQNKITIVSPPRVNEHERIAQLESSNVSPETTDNAIEKVDEEETGSKVSNNDNDSEGECPNFSIYSSTSMDIAKTKKEMIENEMNQQLYAAAEDLVQEDDTENDTLAVNDELQIRSTPTEDDSEYLNSCEKSVENTVQDNTIRSVKPQSLASMLNVAPKRKIIKINLSSTHGIKQRLLENENGDGDKKEVDSAASVSNSEFLSHNEISNNLSQDYLVSDKFTESISDIEDERSYTPCLDENKSNKSKDTSIEDGDKTNSGIEGLDTELISEDEGNEVFSDPSLHKLNYNAENVTIHIRERRDNELQPADCEEGEIIEKNKQKIKAKVKELLENTEEKVSDDERKKRKKGKKIDKDDKDKSQKTRNKTDEENLSFKKLTKSGKERNYRERDDKNKKGKERNRSKSTDKENDDRKAKQKKREKRKDIERYDVRNVISDRSRRLKDAFGRDKPRPNSNSPDSHGASPSRYKSPASKPRSPSRRSLSKHRSPPRRTMSRSLSRGRRSTSRRRSMSPKSPNRDRSNSVASKSPLKQSVKQPKRKRLPSKGRRSVSKSRKLPSPHRSPSIKNRTVSPRRRSVSPKYRRSLSPRRRSVSPLVRSPVVRHRRSRSLHNRRSVSRIRSRRRRSLSRNRRSSPRPIRVKSPVRRRLTRRSITRNRSRSPKLKKSRKLKRVRSNSVHKSKSPAKRKTKRRRSHSFSPMNVCRSMSRDHAPAHPHWHESHKSPFYQELTSGSMSPLHISPGWTPPPVDKSPERRNLRVILTTKERNKKKDKKKKSSKRNKTSDRVLKRQPKDVGPSKEVFTSGNNILVSVSFNKNKETNLPALAPIEVVSKKKKRKTETITKPKKDKSKDKLKKKRLEKTKRSKEIENKKPVAIIDLDKSPFKELTPSPKAVIVLSDSDTGEKDVEEIEKCDETGQKDIVETNFPPEIQSLPSSPNRENDYVAPAGPKTPPEPSIKFTIMSKTNPQLRAVNPLHEDEDETIENNEADEANDVQNEVIHKGPNTPPEPPNSPPSSPDAYDPFEPTKSGTPTPERVISPSPIAVEEKHPEVRIDETPIIPCISLEAAQKSNLSADDVIQAKPISPTEKVIALLKSTTRVNMSPVQQLFGDQLYDNAKCTDLDIFSTNTSSVMQSPEKNKISNVSAVIKPSSPKSVNAPTSTPVYLNPVPRIGVYSMSSSPSVPQKITLPSPTKSSPLKSQQSSKLFMNKPSPIKSTPIKPILKTLISKLPMPAIKPLPILPSGRQKTPKKSSQNGNEVIDMDMDSPYSPGSSDFGDLFEPPADNGKHTAAVPPVSYQQQKTTPAKYDPFDSILNFKTKNKTNTTKVAVQQIKKPRGKISGNMKMEEMNLIKILDDLPSSAVEMQVKTKYLKKLNRQERVVEEVKLVLKPHYSKKHINKEEYKEILRRAVPKICHNRSGEINPAKIHALIEAYVRKFRKKALLVK